MAPTRDTQARPARKQSTLGPAFFKSGVAKPSPNATHAKTTSRTSITAVPNRVQTDVILAIRHVHLHNILTRQKNHEYRTYRLRDGVERLWLYETRGTEGTGSAAITHIATIPPNVRRTPGTVPEEPFGIGNSDFNAGLKQSKYGYPVLELYELTRPIELAEMKAAWGMGGAPMGWCYVKEPMWQDRWGDEKGRDTRVNKIF